MEESAAGTALEKNRDSERTAEVQEMIRICSSMMSLPLYLAFWLADLIYAPQLKWEFLGLRCLMIPICLASYWGIGKARGRTAVELIGLGFTFANAAIITVMIFLTEGTASPYYAGLNLVAIGCLSFIAWSNRMLPFVVLAIFGPYYLVALFKGPDHQQVVSLALNSFFVCGTVILSLVIHFFRESLRMTELALRAKLQDELESRERVIAQKTQEALKLSTLTKQFSPQVVHSIKSGQLDIYKPVHSASICAIFIDIVNSTDRVCRIDKDSINRVISGFMEDTMKTLLKFDITIDKFLGDGVLGFSNDPIQHTDFVERTVDAALEVVARIAGNQELYSRYWLSELQIRVGVSQGMADVGFYGSDQYFKTYTAIGRTVNLASRLCGAAAPNQILVSDEVAKAISPSKYLVRPLQRKQLKGFEAEHINFYEVKDLNQNVLAPEIETCPSCQSILHLDTDASGIYIFKCRSCDYVSGAPPSTSVPQAA